VTAVIGSGVLALAWSVAQLGWVAGPLALAGFACVTYYTSTLLANAYRAPHPVTGARSRTYMDAVRSYLSTRAEPCRLFLLAHAQLSSLICSTTGQNT
jgi:amino acid permease